VRLVGLARRVTVWGIGVVLLLYGAILVWFSANERRLIYFPEAGPVGLPGPTSGLAARRITIVTPDHLRLVGWSVTPPPGDLQGRWVLILHGNAGNIATPGRIEHDRQLHGLGLGIVAFDYRGYGESEGTPTESGLYTDARAAYDFLRDSLGAPASRIVIYGHSLGSAVAIELASTVAAGGLIVEGGFTSLPDLGAEIYPWLPVRALARSRFASLDRIGSVRMPILCIHGRDDTTIPVAQGRRLFAGAPGPKEFLEVAGGHDDAYEVGRAEYERGIRRFLERLR
jgi:fermentation-respiration switch protein FrsA (DUF1100 family)